jgi:hypothetical protein
MSERETASLFQSIRDGLDDLDNEVDYLRWFKQNADFGQADSDVQAIHAIMDKNYTLETGKPVPEDWAQEDLQRQAEADDWADNGFDDGEE